MKNIFSKVKKTIIKEYPNVKNDIKTQFHKNIIPFNVFVFVVTATTSVLYQYSLYKDQKKKLEQINSN